MSAKLNGNTRNELNIEEPCNCRVAANCPLEGRCNKSYIGMTEGKFKARYANHTASFKHPEKKCVTGLSKHVWSLKLQDSGYYSYTYILCNIIYVKTRMDILDNVV